MKKLIFALLAVALLGAVVPDQAAALPPNDIVLTVSPSVLGARLHFQQAGEGYRSYDVNADGTGTITFYRRTPGANGYPRGAVILSSVLVIDEKPFNVPNVQDADSVSFSATTATKVIVRPIK